MVDHNFGEISNSFYKSFHIFFKMVFIILQTIWSLDDLRMKHFLPFPRMKMNHLNVQTKQEVNVDEKAKMIESVWGIICE